MFWIFEARHTDILNSNTPQQVFTWKTNTVNLRLYEITPEQPAKTILLKKEDAESNKC